LYEKEVRIIVKKVEVYNEFINYFYTYKIYSHLSKDGISSKNQILSFALKRKISKGMRKK
jgi:hypothetical protein